MKNESTALARQRVKYQEERERERESEWERADTDLAIIFLIFCHSSSTCLLAGSVFMALQQAWYLFAELTQNKHHNFLAVFKSSRLIPNWLSFPVFYPMSTFNGFSTWVPFSQPQPVADLVLIHFYF